jgi:serine/threonine protein kinase
MNTKRQNKRQNKRQKQSKKVKRKTKTYKKRSMRKYGGDWSPHYLYSAMFHGLEKRPVYKFDVTSRMGKGSFASTYLGKIKCDPNEKRVCIKEYGEQISSTPQTDIIPMFSKTLQNMKVTPEGQVELSFPFDKEYMLRIYGKKYEDEATQREFRGTELHKTLSQECSKYVCKLFDYGTILKKNYIRRLFGLKYQEKTKKKGNMCEKDDCLYALLEKGKEDMEYYCKNRLRGFTQIIKNLYVIAMKMIRNIYCLHSKHIMHYDIKLGNCVFFPNTESEEISLEEIEKICNLNEEFINDVKLIDFGFAEKLEQKHYNAQRRAFGSYGLRYFSHCDIHTFYHSRFQDIYAILYDITEMMVEIGKRFDVDTLAMNRARTESQIFNIKIETKIQINREKVGCPDDLPLYLQEQVKLLEQPKFSDVPYQNILNKLKKEYLDLDRPR